MLSIPNPALISRLARGGGVLGKSASAVSRSMHSPLARSSGRALSGAAAATARSAQMRRLSAIPTTASRARMGSGSTTGAGLRGWWGQRSRWQKAGIIGGGVLGAGMLSGRSSGANGLQSRSSGGSSLYGY